MPQQKQLKGVRVCSGSQFQRTTVLSGGEARQQAREGTAIAAEVWFDTLYPYPGTDTEQTVGQAYETLRPMPRENHCLQQTGDSITFQNNVTS